MNRIYLLLLLGSTVLLSSCNRIVDAITGATLINTTGKNSYFENAPFQSLQWGTLEVIGEVESPGIVSFDQLFKRTIHVKEFTGDLSDKEGFVGAYRYAGYSLYDILNEFKADKANKDVFLPAIDLFVVIRNAEGQQVVFSWGEVFLASIPHRILIATDIAPILPKRKKVDYPVPSKWKVVAGNDLLSCRFLNNPVSIEVRSFHGQYTVVRNMEPMFSEYFRIIANDTVAGEFTYVDTTINVHTYNRVFYGLGMGFHGTKPAVGVSFREAIQIAAPAINPQLADGLIAVVGIDGYRCVYSVSEVFNRNDYIEVLLLQSEEDGGRFRTFAAADFFADRSVKAISEVVFFSP